MGENYKAIAFAYRDYKRRRKLNYRRKHGFRRFLKLVGLILFIAIIIWLIHDTIIYILESLERNV
ncbi:MAG: hypothetical protein HGGPFJEG_03087 [Ignavibacteria bacterium]|nr:hypothetical protein [Ignavibacteria bacterium]